MTAYDEARLDNLLELKSRDKALNDNQRALLDRLYLQYIDEENKRPAPFLYGGDSTI